MPTGYPTNNSNRLMADGKSKCSILKLDSTQRVVVINAQLALFLGHGVVGLLVETAVGSAVATVVNAIAAVPRRLPHARPPAE